MDPTQCLLRRAGALLLDTLIVCFPFAVWWIAQGKIEIVAERLVFQAGWPGIARIIAAWIIYGTLQEALPGHATLGKHLCGIEVINAGGIPAVSWQQALGRNLMRLLEQFPFPVIGGSSVFWSTGHRRLGDMAAGTLVIRRAERADEVCTPWSQAAPAQTHTMQ